MERALTKVLRQKQALKFKDFFTKESGFLSQRSKCLVWCLSDAELVSIHNVSAKSKSCAMRSSGDTKDGQNNKSEIPVTTREVRWTLECDLKTGI